MAVGRLRAVPDQPPRALGLIRVSKEREGMISPEVQRVAINDYVTARGYALTACEWAEDGFATGLDESGSRAKSAWWPRLDQAVAAVEDGEYDVIVVWKFSRTARHRLRWAVALDRVESAGGRLESATEQLDITTSAGRFARGVLGELNAFEAERIGETWKEAHAKRIRSGRPHTGKPRWGYAYDSEHKVHVPHPEQGPVLADLYARFIAGESIYALTRWLNAHGWRTLDDRLFSERSLRRVLDSGFASGQFLVGDNLHAGVHEPLISMDTWQAFLDQRVIRRRQPPRTIRSPYLLSGLVRCGRCGGTMRAGNFSYNRRIMYRCSAAMTKGGEACVGGYANAVPVEAAVYEWLLTRAGRIEVARADAVANDSRRVTLQHEGDRLARELARNSEALVRLVSQDAARPLPAAVYTQARDELEAQRVSLEEALSDARRQERGVIADPAIAAAALVESWDETPLELRREGLRELIAAVWVITGQPGPRVEVYGKWEPLPAPDPDAQP